MQPNSLVLLIKISCVLVWYVQGWAKECVNLRPTARGSQEVGFTQPKDHSFGQPCNLGSKCPGATASIDSNIDVETEANYA